MWLSLNNAFLSIVQPAAADPKSNNGQVLLVRARIAGHIEAVFPHAEVVQVPGRDYQFRAYIGRAIVADAVAAKINSISYGNFKSSVKNAALHDAYACCWGVMAQEQEVPPYESAPRRRKRFAVDPRNPYRNDGSGEQ